MMRFAYHLAGITNLLFAYLNAQSGGWYWLGAAFNLAAVIYLLRKPWI